MNKMAKSRIQYKIIAMLLMCFMVCSQTVAFASTNDNNILKQGKTYYGFKFLKQKIRGEDGSSAKLFEHIKTGAKLIYLDNNDSYKCFNIGFKTPPVDDTGTPHIIEHSVLQGSKKFPVKSPFMEMQKRSLCKYMNAYTADDHTAYPIITKNDKDFKNLIDVYLDAVFNPVLLKQKEIFLQEGWSYILDKKEDPITCSGVVYNEMKGTSADASSKLMHESTKSLYPDTPYTKLAGGDPEKIPTLTYEKCINYYKEHYHPSNSCICLAGNLNLLDMLKFIDEEYLCKYSKSNIKFDIPTQKPFKERRYNTIEYGIPGGVDPTDKTCLSMNYVIDSGLDSKNKEMLLAFDLLSDVLANKETSVLRQCIVETGLAQDISAVCDSAKKQPCFSIIVTDARLENVKQIEDIIDNALAQVAKDGIDKTLMNATIKSNELYSLLVKCEGISGWSHIESMYILSNWAHGEDLFSIFLEPENGFDSIKNKDVKTRYFEKLITKYLVDNKFSSVVVMKPVEGMETKKLEQEQEKLNKYKTGLSDKEIQDMVEATHALKIWGNTPNAKESLKMLPKLSLEDVEMTYEPLNLKIDKQNNTTIMRTEKKYDSLVSMRLYFDTTKVQQSQLPYLYLLSNLLGKVDTSVTDYESLAVKVNNSAGNMYYAVNAYEDSKNKDTYYPKFSIGTVALTEDIKTVFDLIGEVVQKSKFDDVKRLKYLIGIIKSNYEDVMNSDSSGLSMMYLTMQHSQGGMYNSIGIGKSFYEFITKVDKLLVSNPEEVINNLNEVYGLIFQKGNLFVGVTAGDYSYNKFKDELNNFTAKLKDIDEKTQQYNFVLKDAKTGIGTQESVQHVNLGYNINQLGYSYSGKMNVLSNILSNGYLYDKVRALGGAYGSGFFISGRNEALFYSYNDPNIERTLDEFKKVENYLSQFDVDKDEMAEYIIGTVKMCTAFLTQQERGILAEIYYLQNIIDEDILRERKELLNTTVQDIRNFAKMIKDICDKNCYCVSGNRKNIEENKELFDEVIIPVLN